VKAVLDAITEADLPAVGRFMHDNLNPRVADDDWAKALRVPWQVASPNHGYLLRHDGRVVGGIPGVLLRADRRRRVRRICNLGAWCVLEEYRAEGIRLLAGAPQPARLRVHGPVSEWQRSSPSTSACGSSPSTRARHSSPTCPARRASGPCRGRPDNHRGAALRERSWTSTATTGRAAAAHHLVTTDGTDHCYVIWRRDRRKGLPLFATILYVSDKAVFLRSSAAVTRRLAVRHGIPATLIEARVAGGRPGFSLALSASRPKMFKSARLAPQDIVLPLQRADMPELVTETPPDPTYPRRDGELLVGGIPVDATGGAQSAARRSSPTTARCSPGGSSG
jgi:hypothetical protein